MFFLIILTLLNAAANNKTVVLEYRWTPVAGMPVNVIDGLLGLGLILMLVRPTTYRFVTDRVHPAFKWVLVLFAGGAVGGIVGSFFNDASASDKMNITRNYLAMPISIILGYAFAALLRWLMVALLLTTVALIAGMQIGGNGIDLFGLYALAIMFNVVGVLWASGVAMRVRSIQAAPLMQTPVFMLLFLAPVYVPLHLLRGWIHAVAKLNPVTYILTAGRGFISGSPEDALIAFALVLAIAGGLSVWALRGLRKAERAI